MRRLHIFIIILTAALAIVISLVAVSWYLAATTPAYYGSSWMGQMWGGMGGGNYGGMGGMMGDGYGTTTTSYLWVIPASLIAVSIISVIGVAFYFFYPELRYIRGSTCTPQKTDNNLSQLKVAEAPVTVSPNPPISNVSSVSSSPTPSPTVSNSCDVLLKSMTPEEQKVLNVLMDHKGKYLQKYIAKEAGLTRLKTHRVVARFAQRGIVTVKEFGNTNEIALSDWVKGSPTAGAVEV